MSPLVQEAPLPPAQADLAALYAHWRALGGGRAMPARADVDVVALRRWLGSLVLLAFWMLRTRLRGPRRPAAA